LLLWNLFALLPRQVALEGTVAVELACKALPMELGEAKIIPSFSVLARRDQGRP
jgi:hypothetical protein